MRLLLLSILYAALSTGLWADTRLPALFGDHMVVQRAMPVHVWGWADPGEAVSVTFRGQEASALASADGKWEVYLEPAAAGGPYDLSVKGKNSIQIEDILVGDIWVGSGQSNMVWPLQRSNDAEKEIAAAQYPGIRYFKVALTTADDRKDDVEGEWRIVTPETAGELSGVGYFFARHLHKELGVPFGIVQSAWGGTPAEAWTSSRTLAAEPSLAEMVTEFKAAAEAAKPAYEARLAAWEKLAATAKAAGKEAPRQPAQPRELRGAHTPAALFNAMIAPLTSFPIRGVIWYQGENNAGRGQGLLYRRLNGGRAHSPSCSCNWPITDAFRRPAPGRNCGKPKPWPWAWSARAWP